MPWGKVVNTTEAQEAVALQLKKKNIINHDKLVANSLDGNKHQDIYSHDDIGWSCISGLWQYIIHVSENKNFRIFSNFTCANIIWNL